MNCPNCNTELKVVNDDYRRKNPRIFPDKLQCPNCKFLGIPDYSELYIVYRQDIIIGIFKNKALAQELANKNYGYVGTVLSDLLVKNEVKEHPLSKPLSEEQN